MTKINIVYCIDESYVKPCLTSMISLLENTRHQKEINFYLLTNKIGTKYKKIIQEKIVSYGAKISIIVIDDCTVKNIDPGFISHYATFFRLLMDLYIPDNISKILYLDADTIILGDISDLYFIDIGDNIVGVVEHDVVRDSILKKLSLQKYFNAGIILIDFLKWKKENIGQKSIDYLLNYGNTGFGDQDALNVVLKDKWFSLPQKWNLNDIFNKIPLFQLTTGIIHYTQLKPWHFLSFSQKNIYYSRYLSMTGLQNIYDILRYIEFLFLQILPFRFCNFVNIVFMKVSKTFFGSKFLKKINHNK